MPVTSVYACDYPECEEAGFDPGGFQMFWAGPMDSLNPAQGDDFQITLCALHGHQYSNEILSLRTRFRRTVEAEADIAFGDDDRPEVD
jgi:hypothetical protein